MIAAIPPFPSANLLRAVLELGLAVKVSTQPRPSAGDFCEMLNTNIASQAAGSLLRPSSPGPGIATPKPTQKKDRRSQNQDKGKPGRQPGTSYWA